jgi:hypothetical protein
MSNLLADFSAACGEQILSKQAAAEYFRARRSG